MAIEHEKIFTHTLPAIESKLNEFRLYGYEAVTKEGIWMYCIRKKWRNKKVESMRMHEIINGILSISPAEYMTYTQIEEQRESDWFSELNRAELDILLAPSQKEQKKRKQD